MKTCPSKWDRLASSLVARFPNLAYDLRVGKAVRLLEAGAVTRTGTYTFQVASQYGEGAYQVDLQEHACECPDSGKGHVCKHRIASYLYSLRN